MPDISKLFSRLGLSQENLFPVVGMLLKDNTPVKMMTIKKHKRRRGQDKNSLKSALLVYIASIDKALQNW